MVRKTSFRVIYALSVYLHLLIESVDVDVDVAFINAELMEDVYIEPPMGYKPKPKGMVLKLNRPQTVTTGMEQGSGQLPTGDT